MQECYLHCHSHSSMLQEVQLLYWRTAHRSRTSTVSVPLLTSSLPSISNLCLLMLLCPELPHYIENYNYQLGCVSSGRLRCLHCRLLVLVLLHECICRSRYICGFVSSKEKLFPCCCSHGVCQVCASAKHCLADTASNLLSRMISIVYSSIMYQHLY